MDQNPVDPGQFKIGMRTLAGAVNIITCMHAGHRYGMTATAVCSASAEPPTVLACINKLSTTHNAVAKGKAFCVNVLRAEDWELSTMFSGGSSGEARFKTRNWTRLATGSPVLIDSLVSFDCHVVKTLAHGTHTFFLGQRLTVVLGANFLAIAARMSLVQSLGSYYAHRAGLDVALIGFGFLCESL